MIEVAGGSLHVVDIGPRDAAGPPIVMLHGASSNLEVMRQPVGERLARTHRVILIDRPGHGWSTRARLEDSTPEIQARMIDEALASSASISAVFVVHSWAGALGARMALDYPAAVAGLVMLAPVAYPWPGGVGRYNQLIATPVIGPLLAYTITLPLGLLLAEPGARGVFLPQTMPDGFVRNTATPLLLRPREFIANAHDLVTLKAAVAEQAPRYARDQGAGHHHRRRCRQDGVDRHPLAAVRGGGAERKADRAAGRRPHGAERGSRSRHRGDRGDDSARWRPARKPRPVEARAGSLRQDGRTPTWPDGGEWDTMRARDSAARPARMTIEKSGIAISGSRPSRESAMYAAIRQGKARAGKAEELTRRIKEGAIPVISGVDGLHGLLRGLCARRHGDRDQPVQQFCGRRGIQQARAGVDRARSGAATDRSGDRAGRSGDRTHAGLSG